MYCAIYRSERKFDSYLFVTTKDCFDRVPDTLRSLLGTLTFVMELDLDPARKLAQADTGEVMRLLREQGYFLQMPPKDRPVDAATN